MANARIVFPIYTVISSPTQLHIVALWLVCQTLEPEDQGRLPGEHLLQIVFFSFFAL